MFRQQKPGSKLHKMKRSLQSALHTFLGLISYRMTWRTFMIYDFSKTCSTNGRIVNQAMRRSKLVITTMVVALNLLADNIVLAQCTPPAAPAVAVTQPTCVQ